MSAPSEWSRALVMGIVNITPNSFSDGSLDQSAAIVRAELLRSDGADIIDLGAEATNPRAAAISAEDEWRRLEPVLAAVRRQGPGLISVDTWKAEVAQRALEAGADIINDVSGGRFDPAMLPLVARARCRYIAGHVPGASLTEVFAAEREVALWEVVEALRAQLALHRDSLGDRLWVDPCLGFGKGDGRSNWDLLRQAGEMSQQLQAPVVIGASRKRFLRGVAPGADVELLDAATVGASLAAVAAGAAVVRVHNVRAMVTALRAFAMGR